MKITVRNLFVGIILIICIILACFFRSVLQGDVMQVFSVGQAFVTSGMVVLIVAISLILLCGATLIVLYIVNPPDKKKIKITLADLLNTDEQ